MAREKTVFALGFFDGVHLGHAALLEKAKERARELGADPAVLTFDLHPDTLVFGKPVPLINSAGGRADIIRRLFGIEKVLCIHFNRETMQMPWQTFLDMLAGELRAVHLVVGHDFSFGYRGEGNAARMQEYCPGLGVGVDVVPAVTLDGKVISSTHIRNLLLQGDMDEARRFLGHPHCLLDKVHSGYKLGRTIGAPTINMRFPEGVLIPRRGVYAAHVHLPDGTYMAVTNVGVRPTVSGEERVTVESYILDFSGDLYGRELRVDFYHFLRPEFQFSSVEALRDQIQADAAATRAFFAEAQLDPLPPARPAAADAE